MIYFIGATGIELIKIGYTSKNPELRFRSIQVASPVPLVRIALIAGGKDREKAIHKRFRRFQCHGEWFRDQSFLRSYIEAKGQPWKIDELDKVLTLSERRAAQSEELSRDAECKAALAMMYAPGTLRRKMMDDMKPLLEKPHGA